MSRDSIVRMAREAGFIINDENPMTHSLERFAALVAAAEREACAKVCDDLKWKEPPLNFAENCAAAIRARGQDPMPLFDDWGLK